MARLSPAPLGQPRLEHHIRCWKMMKLAILTILISALFCQGVLADDLEDFGYQMSYFYLSPSEKAFESLQAKAEQLRGRLESAGNGADILTAVMIARISEKHGWTIDDGHLGAIAKEILKGNSRLAKYVADDSQVDPGKLDVWWASFFGTGDEQFLEKIFRFAGLDLPDGDIGRMLIIGAATWSFKANCRQHEKVLDFAKRKLDAPGLAKSQAGFVRDCIEYASAKKTDQGASVNVPVPASPLPRRA